MLIPSLLLFAHARGVAFNMIPLLYGRIPYDFASTNSHASLWHFGFMVIVLKKAQLDLIKIKASCTCCAYYLIRCQTPEMGARVYSNISGHGSMKERTQDAKAIDSHIAYSEVQLWLDNNGTSNSQVKGTTFLVADGPWQ